MFRGIYSEQSKIENATTSLNLDKLYAEDFQKEAKLLASLGYHKNVTQIYGLCVENGRMSNSLLLDHFLAPPIGVATHVTVIDYTTHELPKGVLVRFFANMVN